MHFGGAATCPCYPSNVTVFIRFFRTFLMEEYRTEDRSEVEICGVDRESQDIS